MTTRVTVANSGPNPVKVEMKGRSLSGRFEATDEAYIPQREFAEFFVHKDMTLQIFEVAPQESGEG